MAEWRLYPEGKVPHVSTAQFHEHRERAPHLEQEHHKERLWTAANMVKAAKGPLGTFSDLGCGDGGLLSLVKDFYPGNRAWGYDFQPSNKAGWEERGVDGTALDVFNGGWEYVSLGSVVACTEVLEHLADPHGIVQRIYDDPRTGALVCSSPWNETGQMHDPCHAWAWDAAGYAAMIEAAGWHIREHVALGSGFQVVHADRYPRLETELP